MIFAPVVLSFALASVKLVYHNTLGEVFARHKLAHEGVKIDTCDMTLYLGRIFIEEVLELSTCLPILERRARLHGRKLFGDWGGLEARRG